MSWVLLVHASRKRLLPHISSGPVLDLNWDNLREASLAGPELKVPPVQPPLPVVSHQAWILLTTISHFHRCSAPLTIPLCSPRPLSFIHYFSWQDSTRTGAFNHLIPVCSTEIQPQLQMLGEGNSFTTLWRSVGKPAGFCESLVGMERTPISCTTCLVCVHGWRGFQLIWWVLPQHLGGGKNIDQRD